MRQPHYHIDVIKGELAQRMSRNRRYSLRSFARDLGVKPSFLSQIMQGKRGLSTSTAAAILENLNLSRTETALFKVSALAAHARSPSERKRAQKEFEKISRSKRSSLNLDDEQFSPISEWYYQAILELLLMPKIEHSESAIAHRLGLQESLVSHALSVLEKQGLIQPLAGKGKKRIYSLIERNETTYDIPSASIRKFHTQMLVKAQQALSDQDVARREFLNMTFAFKKAEIESLKKEIRSFQKQIEQKYCQVELGDSVHQLSIQLFRLDRD